MSPRPPSASGTDAPGAARFPVPAGDQPAAVLLVDRHSGTVVHASPLATELAPGLRLPATLREWSTAAHLQDADGRAPHDGATTLEHVLTAEPRHELVVSAARAHGRTGQRQPLQVLGLALDGAPGRLHAQSLLVFLPVRDHGGAGPAVTGGVDGITARAVLATGLSFTISDPAQADNPLIWVNPAFTRETGYTADRVLGTNCRFLQGEGTDRAAVDRIRTAVRNGSAITETLLNYRADGSAFWNQVSISPVHDADGGLTHFVGIQADVTARVAVDREREAARAEAEHARDQAERAQHEAERARAQAEGAQRQAEQAQLQLGLLAEATSILSATLDEDAALDRLAALVVPVLGDWVAINLLDEQGRLLPATTAHRDGQPELLRAYRDLQTSAMTDDSPVRTVLETGRPHLRADLDLAAAARHSSSPQVLEVVERLGAQSAMYVPLTARQRVLGVMSVVAGSSGRRFSRADLAVTADLARRAALAIDNIRLYEAEHATAVTLQRSLLPRLPRITGLDVAATYLPGSETAEVGGDWYDLLPLPDGTVGIVIGDVMGHDLTAAAAMGQFRSVLRAYAWEGDRPASVLDRVDRLVEGLDTAQLATCLYGRLELGTAPGRARLTYANAGHPAALLRWPDGRVEPLDGGRNVLLGLSGGPEPRAERSIELVSGCLLLLFTDGLVEDRRREIDVGVEQVSAVLRAHRPGAGSQALVDALARVADDGGHDDDVCILVISLT